MLLSSVTDCRVVAGLHLPPGQPGGQLPLLLPHRVRRGGRRGELREVAKFYLSLPTLDRHLGFVDLDEYNRIL